MNKHIIKKTKIECLSTIFTRTTSTYELKNDWVRQSHLENAREFLTIFHSDFSSKQFSNISRSSIPGKKYFSISRILKNVIFYFTRVHTY